MSSHPGEHELAALASDAVGGEQRDELLEHVCNCDECFTRYELAWRAVLKELPSLSTVMLDGATAERIEVEVLRRVRLAQLGTDLSRLATSGLLQVFVTLVRPLVDLGEPQVTRREEDVR